MSHVLPPVCETASGLRSYHVASYAAAMAAACNEQRLLLVYIFGVYSQILSRSSTAQLS